MIVVNDRNRMDDSKPPGCALAMMLSPARQSAYTGKGTWPSGKGRARKGHSVDTNCSAYVRTDPFFAFDVLRKLLGALASRMGGCQYRMTAEEHKLSMHLLGIVEPFIGLSPSRQTITRQPTEILDAIVSHLDSKSDLAALGLSCRRLSGIVFPRHFDYRFIKCKVSSISVWNHLIIHRSLAQNVRRLVIIDERSSEAEMVPRDIVATDTDLESTDDELTAHTKQERMLVSALGRMSALQSISWSSNHSPISVDHVWPALLRGFSLRNMEINDNLVFAPYKQGDGDHQSTSGHRVQMVNIFFYWWRTKTNAS